MGARKPKYYISREFNLLARFIFFFARTGLAGVDLVAPRGHEVLLVAVAHGLRRAAAGQGRRLRARERTARAGLFV